MLKQTAIVQSVGRSAQPPSGGCVLKPCRRGLEKYRPRQPPSGGCVLKRPHQKNQPYHHPQPPSGGCVLKPPEQEKQALQVVPAAFRRLCVETANGRTYALAYASRLQAAVC